MTHAKAATEQLKWGRHKFCIDITKKNTDFGQIKGLCHVKVQLYSLRKQYIGEKRLIIFKNTVWEWGDIKFDFVAVWSGYL